MSKLHNCVVCQNGFSNKRKLQTYEVSKQIACKKRKNKINGSTHQRDQSGEFGISTGLT